MNIYAENVMDYYKHPRNKGIIEDATNSLEENNPLCGDKIRISLKIDDGKIMSARFDGQGCAISQASASMLMEKIEGMLVTELLKLDKEYIIEMLGIPITGTRLKCAMLGLRIAQKAVTKS
ncbi:MAG: Fe-S cluster assembly sulfur transfer protein SufU [Candidatus Woesearchaeota archaeon]